MNVESVLKLLGRAYSYNLLSELCSAGNSRFNELKSIVGCTSKQLSFLLKLFKSKGLVRQTYRVGILYYVPTANADRLMAIIDKIDEV